LRNIFEFIVFNSENVRICSYIIKYNNLFEEYRRVQLNSLYRRGACTGRNGRRCRTCFTLYNQSRVAAKGPTRFDEHLRLFPPVKENDRGTKYIFPPPARPSSFYFLLPRATRYPKAIILPRSRWNSTLSVLLPIYALSIPIRAMVGRSSNLAISSIQPNFAMEKLLPRPENGAG